MLQSVNAHKKQEKKKFQLVKKAINFLNNSTSQVKEIDIRDKAIEVAKNIKKEAKAHGPSQLKKTNTCE